MTEAVNAIGGQSPVAGINYSSPLPALMQLLQYMGGTKTAGSESGGSSTSGNATTNTTGQTDPLMALFMQSMDPNNLSNLVSNLFAQGAAQVPGLTAQFANATGTRVDNNTMLAQSLAMLNQNLAQSIAQAQVQQQANVSVPAATQIAKSNTTQNQQQVQATTQNKTSTSTTSPGNLKSAVGTGAAAAGAGFLLNKFGDSILGKGKGAPGANTAAVPVTPNLAATDYGIAPAQDFGNEAPLAGGTFVPASTNLGSNVVDVNPISDGGGVDAAVPLDVGAPDAGSDVVDFGPDASDASIDAGVAQDVSDSFDSSEFDFSDFFADGGTVGLARPSNSRIIIRGKNSYADGGEIDGMTTQPSGTTAVAPVPRNLPNFGPRLLPTTTGAMNVIPHLEQSPDPITTKAITVNPVAAGVGRNRNVLTKSGTVDAGTVDGTDADSPDSAAGNPGGTTAGSSLGAVGGMSGALGAALGGLTGGLSAAVSMGLAAAAKGAVTNAIAASLTGTTSANNSAATDVAGALGQANASDISAGFTGASGLSGTSTSVASADDVSGTASPSSVGMGSEEGSGFTGSAQEGATSSTTGLGGTESSSPDSSDSSSPDSADSSDSSSSGASDTGGGDSDGGGGDGGGGDGGGEADGGLLKARKKSDYGIDKMKINAMPGEYVLPVDVVDYIGKENIDDLVNLLHAPIRTGTNG
jgi:hypothetical protein